MQLETEYLIVGAGAAGCALAWQLSQAGRDVLVLELRDAATKNKLCAGALGDAALEELSLLCGHDAQEELELYYPAHFVSRCIDAEHINDVFLPTVPRKRFDDWLLASCQAAGARLRDLTRLISIDTHGHVASCTDLRAEETLQIHYDKLIGADGATSQARRLLTGRNQHIVVSLEGFVTTTYPDIICEYHPGRPGYCWYIPSGEQTSVGCMLHDSSAQDCRTWTTSFCEKLGIELPALRGAPIPAGDDVLLHPDKDIWLIGDAAGLILPLDGGGIHYALLSARLLAESFLEGTPYEEALQPVLAHMDNDVTHKAALYFTRSLKIAKHGQKIG